ncbi:hypothetical protein OSS47_28260 [Pseudomonas citronellolis]|uniref:hypothetical protein n=1 Tax=Pseudomonas citronellolis TaxID=53408 RepID=UPI0022700241|nr:hypothetical protein [Pseudomonas citronellolis]WAB91963.1 hypothetical protein OSS47_28260 [Pseudomonas citronellolis]
MAVVLHHKVVSALPVELEPNSIYFVRRGAGYDQFVTNATGLVVAYPMNLSVPELAVVLADGQLARLPLDARGEIPIQLADGSLSSVPAIGGPYG